MASWVTHLMLADRVLKQIPSLDRRSFCVGNIAPDCNVENADWTQFTPPREVTHWMSSSRKVAADCECFYAERIESRALPVFCEEHAFLLGYYTHLIADAAFQQFIRDPLRVAASWTRIKSYPILREKAIGMPETWDSIKQLIPTHERMKDIDAIEAAYLQEHPSSGFLTEIMPLTAFPDYLDFLPPGAIVRKIGVMGRVPIAQHSDTLFVAMTLEEYAAFVRDTTERILAAFRLHGICD